jgi:ABC-type amino acid transport substrate-binding protein
MYRLKLLLPVVLVTLAAVFGQNCPAGEPTPMRVGVAPVFPPVIYKEGGKIVGIEADQAQALGAELGRLVKFVELKWEELIPALVDGEIDIIMSDMSVTPARELRIAFAKPYLGISQIPLVRREDAFCYTFVFPAHPTGVIGGDEGHNRGLPGATGISRN